MVELSFRDEERLLLICELGDFIADDVAVISAEEFVAQRSLSDLVTYRLSTIGEACRQLSDEARQEHPDIPWRRIYDLRNLIVHDYGTVDMRRVYDVAVNQLPTLVSAARSLLERSA